MSTELYSGIDTDIFNKHITIREWAEASLTDEEFEEYLIAETRNNELMQHYQDIGLVQREPVIEEVYIPALGQNIKITVGIKTILAPGVTVLDIPIDPEFGDWHARYASDPNINYNPTIQI